MKSALFCLFLCIFIVIYSLCTKQYYLMNIGTLLLIPVGIILYRNQNGQSMGT